MLQRRTLYCESNSLHPVKGKNIIEKTEYRNRLVAHQEIQNSVTLLGYSVLVGILFLTRLQIFNIPFYLKMLQTVAVLLAIGTLSISYLCKSENNLWIQVMNCRLIYINSLFVKISNQIVQLEEDEPDRNYKRGMRKKDMYK
ncbi:hypothetical protein [Fusicatenibacter sp.]